MEFSLGAQLGRLPPRQGRPARRLGADARLSAFELGQSRIRPRPLGHQPRVTVVDRLVALRDQLQNDPVTLDHRALAVVRDRTDQVLLLGQGPIPRLHGVCEGGGQDIPLLGSLVERRRLVREPLLITDHQGTEEAGRLDEPDSQRVQAGLGRRIVRRLLQSFQMVPRLGAQALDSLASERLARAILVAQVGAQEAVYLGRRADHIAGPRQPKLSLQLADKASPVPHQVVVIDEAAAHPAGGAFARQDVLQPEHQAMRPRHLGLGFERARHLQWAAAGKDRHGWPGQGRQRLAPYRQEAAHSRILKQHQRLAAELLSEQVGQFLGGGGGHRRAEPVVGERQGIVRWGPEPGQEPLVEINIGLTLEVAAGIVLVGRMEILGHSDPEQIQHAAQGRSAAAVHPDDEHGQGLGRRLAGAALRGAGVSGRLVGARRRPIRHLHLRRRRSVLVGCSSAPAGSVNAASAAPGSIAPPCDPSALLIVHRSSRRRALPLSRP